MIRRDTAGKAVLKVCAATLAHDPLLQDLTQGAPAGNGDIQSRSHAANSSSLPGLRPIGFRSSGLNTVLPPGQWWKTCGTATSVPGGLRKRKKIQQLLAVEAHLEKADLQG